MTIVTLIAVTALYSAASYATYNQSIRHSAYFTSIMLTIAVVSALMWSKLVQSQINNNSIAVLSLIWDLIIVLTYSILPLILHARNPTWQFYLALCMAIFGVMWLKMLTEE